MILIFNQEYEANYNTDRKDYGKERYNDLCNYMDSQKAICLVVLVKEVLCGYIWFFRWNNNRIHINEFAVEENWRGQGLGTLLINEVYKYAEKTGCKKVELFVVEKNEMAKKFYFKQGYETEKRLLVKCVDSISLLQGAKGKC